MALCDILEEMPWYPDERLMSMAQQASAERVITGSQSAFNLEIARKAEELLSKRGKLLFGAPVDREETGEQEREWFEARCEEVSTRSRSAVASYLDEGPSQPPRRKRREKLVEKKRDRVEKAKKKALA